MGEVIMTLFGKTQFIIFNAAMIACCILFAGGYLSITSQWLYTVIKHYNITVVLDFISIFVKEKITNNINNNEIYLIDENRQYRECIVLIISALFCLIGFCAKDLKIIAKISIFKTIFIVITCIVIGYASVTYPVCINCFFVCIMC